MDIWLVLRHTVNRTPRGSVCRIRTAPSLKTAVILPLKRYGLHLYSHAFCTVKIKPNKSPARRKLKPLVSSIWCILFVPSMLPKSDYNVIKRLTNNLEILLLHILVKLHQKVSGKVIFLEKKNQNIIPAIFQSSFMIELDWKHWVDLWSLNQSTMKHGVSC